MGQFDGYRRRRWRQPWIYQRTRFFALTRYRIIKYIFSVVLLIGIAAAHRIDQLFHADASSNVPRSRILVTDGDTVRSNGYTYRLVGFDAPEKDDLAHCDHERVLAAAATHRLEQLISERYAVLKRVRCSCRPGTEETHECNYGRRCGTLEIDGRDVGPILISEGLAHSYICGEAHCPRRESWCD
jgi:endonuclease YncB( thermonuclease family)